MKGSLAMELLKDVGGRPKKSLIEQQAQDLLDLPRADIQLWGLCPSGGEFRLFNVEADPLETHNIASDFPEIVAELSDALSVFPRAVSIGLDMQTVVDDPDFFGGKEDREPWADQAYRVD